MNNALSIRNFVGSKIRAESPGRSFEHAVDEALQFFSKEHPEWVAALFDEHFLKNAGRPILLRLVEGSMGSLAEQLASAWVDQIYTSHRVRQDLVHEFKPVAARFLQSVQMALQNKA